MTKTVSALGIYVKHGDTANEDVFYYRLGDRTNIKDEYMAVPAAKVFKPFVAYRPEEDRGEWVAVGNYWSSDYDVVITTETLRDHQQRITAALLDQVDDLQRSKKWYMDRLTEETAK